MAKVIYPGLENHPEHARCRDLFGDRYGGMLAFELSDGTVEVGAGLGHALGLAGEAGIAKQMADYYTLAAQDQYLPPVQGSFVHLGIGEYDEAIKLLEQAYMEKSWFLIFMQIEPWYDPIRKDERFADIMRRMQFPE